MATLQTWPWPIIGVVVAGLTLLIVAWVNLCRPWLRQWRRQRPEVHFVIRSLKERALSYALQDDERHHVRTLVLPSHSTVEIEVGFFVRASGPENQIIFGCDGDDDTKPYASQWIDRFSAGGSMIWNPGSDQGHSLDVHKFYHRNKDTTRTVGTHYVNSFTLVTRYPGVYRTYFTFLGDEREINAKLQIIVESKPKTRMKCLRHEWCNVRPVVTIQAPSG
jgi:hypothetical protein